MREEYDMKGRYKFRDIGRNKVTKEVDIVVDEDVIRTVRPHLMSRDIDWTYDAEKNVGRIFAGMNCVGTFEKIQ